MKIEYSILAALIGLLYVVLIKFFPDFPFSPDVLMTFLLYVLLKLGVEVIGKPLLLKAKSLFAGRE